MSCRKLLILPMALVAAPLAAQGFEGVLTIRLPNAPVQDLNWSIKGSKSVGSFVTRNDQTGDIETKYYVDVAANTTTSLLATPGMEGNSGSKGLMLVRDLFPKTTDAAAPKPRKLGTSQTVAGIKCDDYELTDPAKTRACLATGMGAFVYPSAPPRMMTNVNGAGSDIQTMQSAEMAARAGAVRAAGADQGGGSVSFMRLGSGDGGAPPTMIVNGQVMNMADAGNGVVTSGPPRTSFAGTGPTWARAIGNNGFPLRVWSTNGTTVYEVMTATKTAVADKAFTIPEGYSEMRMPAGGGAQIMRAGGGGGGGMVGDSVMRGGMVVGGGGGAMMTTTTSDSGRTVTRTVGGARGGGGGR